MSENKNLLSKLPIFQKLKSIKHIEIYVSILFILILIAIFFGGNIIKTPTKQNIDKNDFNTYEYASYLEEKLSKVLSDVNGAGKVNVMLSIESTSEIVYATSTEEKTNSSSITNGSTSNKITVIEPIFASGKPVVVKEFLPKINGVIVVSQGANDIKVKLELLKAVQTLLDVPTSKIKILVGNK